MALERLEVTPGEAIFVDDFIENVEAARSAGLYSVHFLGPEEARLEVTRLLDGK